MLSYHVDGKPRKVLEDLASQMCPPGTEVASADVATMGIRAMLEGRVREWVGGSSGRRRCSERSPHAPEGRALKRAERLQSLTMHPARLARCGAQVPQVPSSDVAKLERARATVQQMLSHNPADRPTARKVLEMLAAPAGTLEA